MSAETRLPVPSQRLQVARGRVSVSTDRGENPKILLDRRAVPWALRAEGFQRRDGRRFR
jgi:hypothetical protein